MEDLALTFEKAASFVRASSHIIKKDDLLYLYSRFKQVTEGDCNKPCPGYFDFQGKAKWQAWKSLHSISRVQARRQYVEKLTEICPNWSNEDIINDASGNWVRVSTMQVPLGDETCSQAVQWIRDGSLQKLKESVNSREKAEFKEENSMSLLHWACDKGDRDIVCFLLGYGVNVNVQDVDGQTPLHYATSCGHVEIVRVLVSRGASVDICDNAGCTPAMYARECDEADQILKILDICA